MTTALEGGEWSAARPGRTLPPGKTRYPFYRRLVGSQGRSGRTENLVLTAIRFRTVQPVVSYYTDWATRPTTFKGAGLLYSFSYQSRTGWSENRKAEGAKHLFFSRSHPYHFRGSRDLLLNRSWVYFSEIRRWDLEFDHWPPSSADVKAKWRHVILQILLCAFVTSIGVTFSYLTSKCLVLIEDYSVSKFHVTSTQRYWQTI